MTDDQRSDTILLVEDTASDREMTLRVLQRHGVTNEIVTVESGREALDYLFGMGRSEGRDAGVLPLVMLLELRLPQMDGIEVLRRLRANLRTKSLPVIVVTESLEEREAMQTYALHARHFLQKPFTFEAFERGLKKLGLLGRLRRSTPATRR